MGSGHFLVAAAAYIAQFVATDPSYTGKLTLGEIQRLVAERCLYGVDVNPLAVELAQLSLWLATVVKGEPLAFLSNLREGNSLVGASLGELRTRDSLFAHELAESVEELLEDRKAILAGPSATGLDVHAKEVTEQSLEAVTKRLTEMADAAVRPPVDPRSGRFFHWELEFPEVFLDLSGDVKQAGGFDAVVGNPPYIRIQAFGRDLAEYCRRRYATARGSFDAYVPFLERSIRLLQPGGRLGFIVPSKWLRLEYGERLRDLFASEKLVEEIVDFGAVQLFEGATNYTSILVLDRNGHEELTYRRAPGEAVSLREALPDFGRLGGNQFATASLGPKPWRLAAGEAAAVLETANEGARALEDVTSHVFQGLITSADSIYILEHQGDRGGRPLWYSRAEERLVELETELLHPLASGGDVEPYAIRPVRRHLLFPYRVEDGNFRLLTEDELVRYPLTWSYLRRHEAALRARERHKMDRDGWYGYVYPKNLGAHALPKLGVPRLCLRLRASVDEVGGTYFDNVDVNGILPKPGKPSLWYLGVLLNSSLLHYVFALGSVPFRGSYLSANRQFIAPLPVRLADPASAKHMEGLGKQLHSFSRAASEERTRFFEWTEAAVGIPFSALNSSRRLSAYEQVECEEVIATLRKLAVGTARGKTFSSVALDAKRQHAESSERLALIAGEMAPLVRSADSAVYDLYGLSAAARSLVDGSVPPMWGRSA